MDESRVELINDDGEKLVGLKTTPSLVANKLPVIILVHGIGVNKHEYGMFDELVIELTNANFITYRFDFSGCGESEGNYEQTSLSKLVADLRKIIHFVSQDPQVDGNRIGIQAQSFGTAATLALMPSVKCLVLTGSMAHPKETLIDFFRDECYFDGVSSRVRSNGEVTKVGSQIWPDLDKYDLELNIQQIQAPILFIHGEKDIHIHFSEMEILYQAANHPKKKMILLGKEHGLQPNRQEMYPLAVEWFKKYL